MRRTLVGTAFVAAVAPLLVASLPRAAADGATFTVTSNATIRTSAAIHVQFSGGFPLVQDNQIGPSATNFTTYDHTMDAHVSENVPDVGTLSASSHTVQTTSVVSGVDSVTVDSTGSVTGTATRDPNLGLDDLISGGGSTTLQVQVMATGPVSFTVSASTTVTGPSPGESSVIFSDGREEDRRVADSDIDVGVHRPAASFSRSGRLDGSPSSPAFVELDVTCRGGAGSPFTTGSARWNVQLTIGPASTDGDVYRWIKKQGGSYDTDVNWDLKKVPADDDAERNDTAVFDLPRAYTVKVGGAAAAGAAGTKDGTLHRLERCIVKKGDPTFEITGDLAPDSQSESEPAIEVEGGARLDVTGGRVTSQFAKIGSSGGVGVGAAGVDIGFGARWENAHTMRVGIAGGPGSLAIDDGGFVSSERTVVSNAGTTTVRVKDPNSKWQPGRLSLGLDGSNGTANVSAENGATVETRQTDIGTGAGVAKVSVLGGSLGVRSSWSATGTPGQINLAAFGGAGTLVVDEGAAATADEVYVGVSGPGVGNILIQGTEASGLRRRSSLVANRYVAVGFAHGALGRLNVEQGGQFEDDGGMDVGLNGGAGLVTVSSLPNAPASLDVTGPMTLGVGPGGGLGSMNISGAEADAHVAGDTDVGRIGEGRGLIKIDFGGNLTVVGTLRVVVGSVTLHEGSLNVLDMDIGPNGTLGGTGTVVVAGSVIADGMVSPGNSPGTLTIDGDLVVNSTGVIDAEVAGPDALSDHLIVTGNATLNGTLLLHFMNGFAPKTGDHFEVLHVNGATTGDFAATQVEGLEPGAQFSIAQSGSSYVVTALNDAVALPKVTAKAPKRVKERSKRPVFVTLTRSGKPTAALEVSYVLTGTAESGVDYAVLPGKVTFPAKKRTVKVPIAPVDDFILEGDETVQFAVVPGAGYTRGLVPTPQIVIVDDER